MNSKICSICNKDKKLHEFSVSNSGKYGFRSSCKQCNNNLNRLRRRTKDGIITTIYNNQKGNSIKRNYPPPVYSKQELKKWLFNQQLFHELYGKWEESGYNRKLAPSCDRKDDYKSYTIDNIQLTVWWKNELRSYNDRINGINNKISRAVVATNCITGLVSNFYSLKKATVETGVDWSNISKVCLGKREMAVLAVSE